DRLGDLVGAAIFVLVGVDRLGLIHALVDGVDDAIAVAVRHGAAVVLGDARLVLARVDVVEDAVAVSVRHRATRVVGRARLVLTLVDVIEHAVAVGVGDRAARVLGDARLFRTLVDVVEDAVAVFVRRGRRRLVLVATEREGQAQEQLLVRGAGLA